MNPSTNSTGRSASSVHKDNVTHTKSELSSSVADSNPDPSDSLVRGMNPDPDPPIIMYKIVRKTLIPTVLFCDFFLTFIF
jgi:hypothetical protein